MPVGQHARLDLFIPADHLPHALDAAVQRAGVGGLAVIGRHDHALTHHVLHAQVNGVAAERIGQLIDDRLDRKDSLGRAIATISAGRHDVGINDVIAEAEGFLIARIEWDGLMAGQADCRWAVLAERAGVG